MNAHPTRHLPQLAGPLLVALLAAACGTGTGDLGPVATPQPTPGGSIDAPSAEPTPGSTGSPNGPSGSPAASPAGTTTVRAYFFLGSFTGNSGIVPVLREVTKTSAVGAAAIRALIEGPNETELSASPAMYTSIPDGTQLLGLTIDGGTALVDLSREFEAGADVHEFDRRLAQVVFTLTQFPTVTAVRFQFDGGDPTSIYERSSFPILTPAIWVDRPAWGGVLGNPGRITGLANVFEAQFRVQVLDAAGHSLVDVPVTATCGTGCWGTFDVTIPYAVGSAQWGTLRVYDRSAKDGSKEHIVDYRVWLTPA